jgi:hypothetical protein
MNFEPLIKGISEFIGATAKVGEEGKASENTGRGAVRGGTAHSPADVERWLGPLSAPEKQVPLIHDYLRGHSALAEAQATNATHVRDISVPVWESAQKLLQSKVDADPEVQDALKNLFVGRNTPKDPDVTTVAVRPEPTQQPGVSVEVPQDTPQMPQAKLPRVKSSLTADAKKQQAAAWNEFAISTESQDPPRIDAALERLQALHDSDVPDKPGETPPWKRALNYMAALEQQTQQWRAAGVTNQAWSDALQQFKKQTGIDTVPLPKPARDAVSRFEAWADAQKPATKEDIFGQVLGVPRAVMSSADLSAPGRQGLLMIARPEYWSSLKPMVEAWSEPKYLESQAYLRNHPDFPAAQEAGLAISDIHSKLAPREEAFQSQLAERIPVLGGLVKSSEQAYTTFLNRLRFDVFSNSLKEAAAAGVDVTDKEFTKSLAEWVNTSTGRGGRGFDPGVLSTVLFSPRLAISRLQTFNPGYYYKLDPFVRQQAIKTNMAAAALVFGLVSLAKLGGASVTWDFRNPDAGKIRIGNTRIDVGGGHFQFLRLFAQMATDQKVNSETGKVTELGSKFGVPSRLDVMTQFLISKEAPVASFVTDWMRGKDQAGNKFNLTNEVISRVVPLAMQDMYDVLKDKGVEGLVYAMPAVVGVGLQTYAAKPANEVIPFIGVRGTVPPEKVNEYVKLIQAADTTAAVRAAEKTKNMNPAAAKSVLRNFVRVERLRARMEWIKANRDSFVAAKRAGRTTTSLVAPEGK